MTCGCRLETGSNVSKAIEPAGTASASTTSGASVSCGKMDTKRKTITMSANLNKMTPGEILLEDYMKPMRLTQNALARALGVPPRRVNEIIHGKRAITLDTSLR